MNEIFRWKEFDWTTASQEWNLSRKHLGVVERNGKYYLELWRAMTALDGVICLVEAKQTVIQRIVKELDLFIRGPRSQHIACMLVSPPGSGKTFLIRQLAQLYDSRLLSFNITQMISRDDVLDCFDSIVTNQNLRPEEPILVFVDEINARLDGQLAYHAFLAPLDEGTYVRSGRTHRIAPCFWIFAGTKLPSGDQGHPTDASEKGGDLESRLTVKPLKLEVPEDDAERARARLENVYVGAALIKNAFPDVRYVSEKVLRIFRALPYNIGVRDLKHLVRSFRNVQYSEVRERNVAKEKLDAMQEFDVTDWMSQTGDDLLVRIEGNRRASPEPGF